VRIAFILLLLPLAVQAQSVIQSACSAQCSSSPCTIAMANAVQAGDAVVAGAVYNGTLVGITDTLGNSYTHGPATITGSSLDQTLLVAGASPSGTNTVTLTSTSMTFGFVCAMEVNGVSVQKNPVDVSAAAFTSSTGTAGTAFSSGSATTNFGQELEIGFGAVGTGPLSAGSGFTFQIQPTGTTFGFEAQELKSTGSVAATFSSGAANDIGFASMVTLFAPQASGFKKVGPGKLIGPATIAPVTPPSFASAAGFTHLVFDDEMNTDSVAPSSTSTGNFKWYTFNDSAPSNSLPSGDVTFQNGYMTISTDTSGFSFGVTTIGINNLTNVFQHGYFEARMRYNPHGNTVASPTAWPAFWAFDEGGITQTFTTGVPYGELDINECIPSGGVGSACQMFDTVHQWENNTPGAQGPSTNNPPTVQTGIDYSQWHTFGALWTTDQVQWYLDGVLLNTLATGPGNSFTGLETSHVALILGTGPSWPIDVDYVRAWH
jgi:hypothetical protein